MIVERIWTGNSYRNYNYLIACTESGEALAIDPLDHQKCLAAAKAKGWQITQILNTHEHHDHTGGNAAVVAATGAKVIAHHKARAAALKAWIAASRPAMSSRSASGSSSNAWTRPAIPCATSACARTATTRRCFPATPCSTPAPAIATTAAIRKICTLPSPTSFRPSCRKAPRSTLATTTSKTTSSSPWRASRTMAQPGNCCPRYPATTRRLRWSPPLRRKSRSTHSCAWTSASVIATLRQSFPDLARAAGCQDRVHQAARVAQQVVKPAGDLA